METTMKMMAAGMMAVVLMTGVACAQGVKDDLFAGTSVFEKNATNVTDINMDPNSLEMVTGRHAADAHRMILSTVKSYEYDQPGMYNMADVDKFRDKLNTGDWSCSVHERNLKTGESTDICSKHRTDGYSETAIISVEKKELTFIHKIEKQGSDGHSDATMGALMPGIGGMPVVMAMNSAKMDVAMAKMEAFGETPIGDPGSIILVKKNLDGSNPPVIVMQTDDLHATPDAPPPPPVVLKLRRFEGAPSGAIMMNDEDAKSPKAPAPPPAPMQ